MLLKQLPPAAYRLPGGFTVRASAHVARNLSTELLRQVQRVNVTKTPLEDVEAELEHCHALLDEALAVLTVIDGLLLEVGTVLNILGAAARGETYEIMDEPSVAPAPAPSLNASEQVASAAITLAAMQADADVPELHETIETLRTARKHLQAEADILGPRVEAMDLHLRKQVTRALARCDDRSAEARRELMAGAMAVSKTQGISFQKSWSDALAASPVQLSAAALLARYEPVAELEGVAELMSPHAATKAAQAWVKAEAQARRAAKVRRKATAQRDVAATISTIWEGARV